MFSVNEIRIHMGEYMINRDDGFAGDEGKSFDSLHTDEE